ncbi:MAG: hypothetical protein AABZ36_08545 [Nitrospirota bacterium]
MKDKQVIEGFVNECKVNSLEITTSVKNDKISRGIDLKDIESLLWK